MFNAGAAETAQQLGVFAALLGDLGSPPSTQVRQLTIICNTRSRNPVPSSGLQGHPTQETQTQRHTNKPKACLNKLR